MWIWTDRTSAGCSSLPILRHGRRAALKFGPLVLGSHKRWEEPLVPRPLLNHCGKGSMSPCAGRARWASGKGDTCHTTAWDRRQLTCVAFYRVKVDPPGPTHFWCQQQEPSAGRLACTSTWPLFTKTPTIANVKGNSERVEGLCTAPLKGDSYF